MDFPEENQFTYIIGSNGSGKSRALEKHANTRHFENDVVVISSSASDKFTYRQKPKITPNGSYRYMGNRTVGNGTHNGTLSANTVLLYVEVLQANLRNIFLDFLNQIGFDRKVGIAHRSVKRSSFPTFDTTELTEQFVNNNSDMLSLTGKPFEAVFYKSNKSFKISELSSGEQCIISTALKIIASSSENIIYYIDEPEISLHAEWQIKWPERFQPLLSLHPGVKAFIATHSPVIISNAMQNKAACYLLKANELHRIEEGKFDVEEILFKDFNTLTPNNRHIFSEIATIINQTVTNLNLQSQTTEKVARDAVENLGEKINDASKSALDNASVMQIFEEFQTAINELLSVSQAKPPKKPA
ncbi:AAA family ATPase [Chromobacterium piscinae]|uniref:AAA family ATPase n=1 Tax=Chromobacterium piscinae TaxID=686831 RepID=UPI001E44E4DD|nr:AAA family ATPase [Chromobacterium piscinae]MCD5329371.1 ATP-binding protein [Chromobacterium piscinae]